MPDISFPANPSLNDTYTFGNKTWIWNGSYWALNSAGAINNIPIGNATPSTGAFTTLSATGNITGGNIIATGTIQGSTIDSVNADLAERYIADTEYPPGTVVIFGGKQEITQSSHYADSRIAGVISTAPAYTMNSGSLGQVVALQGRVPCRVVGSISKGDLVTSSELSGVATRLDPKDWVPGSVIGKALVDYNNDSEGLIEIVVGRV